MFHTTKLLNTFACVYKHANYRDAGKDLGVSIATLSRAMSQLENLLEQKLFLNNGTALTPTRKASLLYEAILPLNMQYQFIYQNFDKVYSHVSILLPPQISNKTIIKLINKSSTELNINLTIEEQCNYSSREQVYEALLVGELDLFIDIKNSNSPSFKSTHIMDIPLVLIGSSKYHTTLSKENILTRKYNFAKIKWLSLNDEILFQKFSIKSDERAGYVSNHVSGYVSNHVSGYVSNHVSGYLDIIQNTQLIGLCPQDIKLSNSFITSDDIVATIPLYLITTKKTYENSKETKWLYDNLKDIGVIYY